MAVTKLTTNLNNVQALDNLPNDVQGLTPAELKEMFDKAGNDIKTYINDTLTAEIDTLHSQNVKVTGDQTVAGVKTFTSSPIVPTPTADTQASTKKYVDDKDTTRKSYVDTNFTTKTEISDTRKLSPTGNFTGSWFGISNPEYADPGIANVVAEHTLQLAEYAHIVNVKHENVKGDGTNETLKVQAALDKAVDSNGVFYIPKGMVVYVDSLTITNKSNFKIVVEGVLKRIASGTSTSMFLIAGCTDFDIPIYNADGNVANNGVTLNEQQHLLSIWQNCSNFRIGTVNGKYPAGDVLYLNNCNNGQIDNIFAYGENTGRNALSIISGQKLQFDKIISISIGTEAMPGGVDCEPNANTDVIKNIQFGSVYIETRAKNGFGLSNNVSATCDGITVDSLIIRRNLKNIGTALNNLWIKKFSNVQIKKGLISELTTDTNSLWSTGLYVEGGSNIDLNLDIQNVNYGAKIGYTTNVDNLKLTGSIKDTLLHGCSICFLTNSVIKTTIKNAGMTGAGYWDMYFEAIGIVTDVYFNESSFEKGTNTDLGIRLGGTLTNVWFDKCDFKGWSGYADKILHTGAFLTTGSVIHRVNCKNFNYSSAMPTTGYWQAGEYVENTAPAITGTAGSKYIIKGWKRITSNANNVLNTDWVEDRASTGA